MKILILKNIFQICIIQKYKFSDKQELSEFIFSISIYNKCQTSLDWRKIMSDENLKLQNRINSILAHLCR